MVLSEVRLCIITSLRRGITRIFNINKCRKRRNCPVHKLLSSHTCTPVSLYYQTCHHHPVRWEQARTQPLNKMLLWDPFLVTEVWQLVATVLGFGRSLLSLPGLCNQIYWQKEARKLVAQHILFHRSSQASVTNTCSLSPLTGTRWYSNMRRKPSTCSPCLWPRSQNEAASLGGFGGSGLALSLQRTLEKLHQTQKEKIPKSKVRVKKLPSIKKRGKYFRAYHKQVFSPTPECYQVMLYRGSNPGLITAPLKPVSDHISPTVMFWECVMTGMQCCCCTHAVVHWFISLCASLYTAVFILTCMTFRKNLPLLWEERLPCIFFGPGLSDCICASSALRTIDAEGFLIWGPETNSKGSRERHTAHRIRPSPWGTLLPSCYLTQSGVAEVDGRWGSNSSAHKTNPRGRKVVNAQHRLPSSQAFIGPLTYNRIQNLGKMELQNSFIGCSYKGYGGKRCAKNVDLNFSCFPLVSHIVSTLVFK